MYVINLKNRKKHGLNPQMLNILEDTAKCQHICQVPLQVGKISNIQYTQHYISTMRQTHAHTVMSLFGQCFAYLICYHAYIDIHQVCTECTH